MKIPTCPDCYPGPLVFGDAINTKLSPEKIDSSNERALRDQAAVQLPPIKDTWSIWFAIGRIAAYLLAFMVFWFFITLIDPNK